VPTGDAARAFAYYRMQGSGPEPARGHGYRPARRDHRAPRGAVV